MAAGETREAGGATGTGEKGTVEVGRRVVLPKGARPPIRVYINGVQQEENTDFRVLDREVVFRRPIVKEGKIGAIRWLSMFLGLAGTYRKNEVVDIEFQRGGRTELLPDAEIIPDP